MWCPISDFGGTIIIRYLIDIFHRLRIAVIKAYSTIETKEAVRIGHSGVLFSAGLLRWRPRCTKRNLLYPIRASFVSIVMYPTCTIILLLQNHIPTTTLKWAYWFIYRQASVPFITYQVLEITKYTSLCFFLVNLYRKI
jgi:hypothetical protein